MALVSLGRLAASLALVAGLSTASSLVPRAVPRDTAVIDLTRTNGPPKHLASGFIYGIPDNPTQIPDQFYRDMGFNFARIGGAQMDNGGWIYGMHDYYLRFNNTRDNYLQARKFNASVYILPHDIWGTDHANSSTKWPGDDGDWSDYDRFLDQLLSDLKANDMLHGLYYEIWNEPDGAGFWARSQSQYLDLYTRTHRRVRADPAFRDVPLVGPSTAGRPNVNNPWWVNWMKRVLADDVVPAEYIWHTLPGDPGYEAYTLGVLLNELGGPQRPISINEYAAPNEQTCVGAAWNIGRLERLGATGLRANWLSNCQLRDFMANLLTKSNLSDCTNDQYAPNGEYQVYKYYNLNMTGERILTDSSGDGNLDVYTTVDCDKVRTLAAILQGPTTRYIRIDNLSAVGLPKSGTLNIQTWGFDWKGLWGQVDAPSNRGIYGHQYSGDSVTFPVFQTQEDLKTAWAFEFAVGK